MSNGGDAEIAVKTYAINNFESKQYYNQYLEKQFFFEVFEIFNWERTVHIK